MAGRLAAFTVAQLAWIALVTFWLREKKRQAPAQDQTPRPGARH